MITVDISVNGKTVYARSVVNTGIKGMNNDNEIEYKTDANDIVFHDPDDGILKLATKIIKTIKET